MAYPPPPPRWQTPMGRRFAEQLPVAQDREDQLELLRLELKHRAERAERRFRHSVIGVAIVLAGSVPSMLALLRGWL